MSGENAYAASVQLWQTAVAAATASNEAQQAQAAQWFDGALPADMTAYEPGPADAPNL
jgi:hypothetical protein